MKLVKLNFYGQDWIEEEEDNIEVRGVLGITKQMQLQIPEQLNKYKNKRKRKRKRKHKDKHKHKL